MYAVFGNPVDKSLSPFIINQILDIETKKLTLNSKNISVNDFLTLIYKENISFGNVTYPYKEIFANFSDILVFPANILKSINCFKIVDKKILATNTDGEGFFLGLKTIYSKIYYNLFNNPTIFILGSGSTAKSITLSAIRRGFFCYILSRDPKSKFTEFSKTKRVKVINYEEAISCLQIKMPNLIISTLPFSIKKVISFNYLTEKKRDTKKNKVMEFDNRFNIENIDINFRDFVLSLCKYNLDDSDNNQYNYRKNSSNKSSFDIFESNYQSEANLNKKEIEELKITDLNIHNGLAQLIGQAILSIKFFTGINFSNESKIKEIYAQCEKYINSATENNNR